MFVCLFLFFSTRKTDQSKLSHPGTEAEVICLFRLAAPLSRWAIEDARNVKEEAAHFPNASRVFRPHAIVNGSRTEKAAASESQTKENEGMREIISLRIGGAEERDRQLEGFGQARTDRNREEKQEKTITAEKDGAGGGGKVGEEGGKVGEEGGGGKVGEEGGQGGGGAGGGGKAGEQGGQGGGGGGARWGRRGGAGARWGRS